MNNQKHTHLTEEEMFALTDFRYELLSETMQEVSRCQTCMDSIAELHLFDIQLRDLSSKIEKIPSSDRLAEMTNIAFNAIPAATAQDKRRSFIPMLASVAATLLIAVGIYHFVTPAAQKSSHIETAQNNAKNTPTLTQEEHLFVHDSVIQEGVTTLTMLKDCVLSKKENQHFIMKNGEVRIKVVKGNNTLLYINDEFLVRVLGTEFIVSAYNHHLDVSVIEGMVEVVHLGTGEIKTLTKDQQCHYDFETPHKLLVKQQPLVKPILPVRQKLIAPPLIKPAPTGTLLEQGRIALEKGDSQKALKLFNSALHQKEGADKALFEIIRIHEGKKEYKTVLTYLNKYQKILNEYKTYREEFFIKGCNAQSGIKSGNLSFCTQYLKLFPEGYKRNDIEKVLGDRK